MIQKQIVAIGIALAALWVVYSIATATSQPTQAQQSSMDLVASQLTSQTYLTAKADPRLRSVMPHIAELHSIANQTSRFSAAENEPDCEDKSTTDCESLYVSGTSQMGSLTTSGLAPLAKNSALEDSIQTTLLLEWAVLGIEVLAILTGAILAFFWLIQRTMRG